MSVFLALASATAAVTAAGYGVFRYFSRNPDPEDTTEEETSLTEQRLSHRELAQRDATISRTHRQVEIENDWVLIEHIEQQEESSSSEQPPEITMKDQPTGKTFHNTSVYQTKSSPPLIIRQTTDGQAALSQADKENVSPTSESVKKKVPLLPTKPARPDDEKATPPVKEKKESPALAGKTPPPLPAKLGRHPGDQETPTVKDETPAAALLSKTFPSSKKPVPLPRKADRSPEHKKQVPQIAPEKPPRLRASPIAKTHPPDQTPLPVSTPLSSKSNKYGIAVLPVAFDRSKLSPAGASSRNAAATSAEAVGEVAVYFDQPATAPKLKSPSRNKGPRRRPPSRMPLQGKLVS